MAEQKKLVLALPKGRILEEVMPLLERSGVDAEDALKKHGVLVKSPNGSPMPNPYLAIANKAMEQMRALLAEFGMSPSSRTRVAVEVPEPESDPLEVLRNRNRG